MAPPSTPGNSKTAVNAVQNTVQFSGRAQALIDQGATGELFELGADKMIHSKPKVTPADRFTGYASDRLDATGAAFWDFVVQIIWPCALVLIVVTIAGCICSLHDKELPEIPAVKVNTKEILALSKRECPARQYQNASVFCDAGLRCCGMAEMHEAMNDADAVGDNDNSLNRKESRMAQSELGEDPKDACRVCTRC